jgi:hypothetical protein
MVLALPSTDHITGGVYLSSQIFSRKIYQNIYAMETIRTISKRFSKIIIPFLTLVLLITSSPAKSNTVVNSAPPEKDQSVMIALLLDTSNSMDGLIEQAKSQLWKIVNELAGARCNDGAKPRIKIALYEYGNDNLSAYEGYIRQVSPLTDDLDVISEKLFSLSTNGGNEFCGQVIKTSLNQLAWSTSKADLKMIFIAGNEPFSQGEIPYRAACALAREKDVVVNTIFCGDYDEGIRTDWRSGADLTGGTYMSIAHDRKTVYVPTPYDDRISAMNDKLNETYVYYGRSGASKKKLQSSQDANAEQYGQANKVERAVSKSSHVYSNSSWDLVDASKESEKIISEAKDDELPAEMKGMSAEQRKAYVKQKADARKKIQEEIQSLNKQRQQYISNNTPKENKNSTLDGAMIKAIKERAKEKNLVWQ